MLDKLEAAPPKASQGTYRLIILGAGFSRPAGLPLGAELFREVRRLAATTYGQDNRLERDLKRYIDYLDRCEGKSLTQETVNYEEFLGFLDVEHVLGLKGKDTWSTEGNETQLMVRTAIAKVLHERTPASLPPAYLRFARGLNATDWILTFNYDTLLEQALEVQGIPYRLFPFRFSKIGWGSNVVDSSREELVILKMHGSIDWFDRAVFDERAEGAREFPVPYEVKHPVFGPDRVVEALPLTDGPRSKDDPLASIYRVPDIRPLLDLRGLQCCPLILAPSQTKILYARPLREFWWGIQRAGGLHLSLGVIGYSLPPNDPHVRQGLYHLFSNYTGFEPDLEIGGRRKTKIRLLDLCAGEKEEADLRERYRFADWNRTELRLDGFTEETAAWFLA